MIIEKLGADRYKVEPKVDNYPKDSYKRLTEIASEELHNNARPDIKDITFDVSKYDIIFVILHGTVTPFLLSAVLNYAGFTARKDFLCFTRNHAEL